ncbi:uncharacterized protein CLUP02_00574 [Colletotrichum lupini]|uniref:Uncharacterized protein n=1 Tax=Colletotrichum lupini TaxID=145971 RepID=A0A9Q8W8W4_9PEZI|nr:uncharacterized protein CLUP02_00574 [Colletotrichum lupini]UQC73927.1 hypothetical protein CLUP02_00574 [Colletotrichum lupini]
MWKSRTSSVQLPPNPRINWAKLDSHHPKTLNKELSDLYWSGIDRDLDEILRFLDMSFAKRATRLAVNDALVYDVLANLNYGNSENLTRREYLAQMLLRAARTHSINNNTGAAYSTLTRWLNIGNLDSSWVHGFGHEHHNVST